MHDAGGVRLHQPLGAVADDSDRGRRVDEPDARHAVVEGLAVEVFHRDERPPILETPRVVHVHDVGALHARRRSGFTEEALDDDVRVCQLLREDLERHAFAERHLLGLVHTRHSPAADFARDLVLSGEDSPDRNLRLVGDGLDGGHARRPTRVAGFPPRVARIRCYLGVCGGSARRAVGARRDRSRGSS